MELTLIGNAPLLETCPSEAGFFPVSMRSVYIFFDYYRFYWDANDALSRWSSEP